MTDKQRNAPSHPKSRHSSGVTHVNEPHYDNFTVVGNHLAQHPELSLTAIGLATHIQSLPEGTPIGIKALAAKFREGEIRIAAALRELEEHGYLARPRERLQSGQVRTRAISYNKPRSALRAAAAPPAEPEADPGSAPAPGPPPTPVAVPASAPGPPPAPDRRTPAADLLAGLRAHDPRLLLAERDVHRLAPAVTEWLERGVPPTAVTHMLTSGLPQDPIKHPAALLSHRLATQLPPHLPAPPPRAAMAPRPTPLQTCDGCDRAFRAPEPGRCRDCRTSAAVA
ncbi:helix-turn-helix domain-containing protein [Streptomyces sp. CMSTAAHL-2]|uniref:helix-turn-helix domain-containing protein n=1 Tax=Streptomyces sp. CMSTAAHL-2 TaxID=2904522 RepID=UPI001E577D44|nr:helix-turn-helix domain-containing protein [Streptomyces sp. CMSTAAHL-2]MCE3031804.1 helix-turn-helix domain-containing protein [Streptomyces sp. CMSTAAHL-2]